MENKLYNEWRKGLAIDVHNYKDNILGYLEYQYGISELGRLIEKWIDHAKISYVVNTLSCIWHILNNKVIKNFNKNNTSN